MIRVLRTVFSEQAYVVALESCGLATLHDRRQTLFQTKSRPTAARSPSRGELHPTHKSNSVKPLFNLHLYKINCFKKKVLKCSIHLCYKQFSYKPLSLFLTLEDISEGGGGSI